MSFNYLQNNQVDLNIARGASLTTGALLDAIQVTHQMIEKFQDFPVDVFALLGLRNLSAFIGEMFAASLIMVTQGQFRKNPHQDGYPDLLLMDKQGARAWAQLTDRLREKAPFSPFLPGGVEIKATCGATRSAMELTKRGLEKPDIGVQRVSLVTGYDWKAHHRDTNHLLGVFWDFVDGAPAVIAVFYSSRLCVEDWGKIVKPKDGGGRTTSVSILSRGGIRKMYDGWVLCMDDARYVELFNRYNRATAIPQGAPR